MILSDWLELVQQAVTQHFPVSKVTTQIIRSTRAKVRIEIGEDIFADLFFREETGRIDYTLIVGEMRYFGLDNLDGWHEHPIGSPETHVPVDEPTPWEAIIRLRNAADQIRR
jgi:hypothetical protein